ncbi:hypothetical protein [Pseudomonas sp.]
MNNFYSYFTHSQQYEHIDPSSQDMLEELGEEMLAAIMDGIDYE